MKTIACLIAALAIAGITGAAHAQSATKDTSGHQTTGTTRAADETTTGTTDTRTNNGTDTTDTARTDDGTDATDAVRTNDGTDATDAVRTNDGTDATDAVRTTDGTDAMDMARPDGETDTIRTTETTVTPNGATTTTTTTTSGPMIADLTGGAEIPPARGNDNLYATDHAYLRPIPSVVGIGFVVGGGLTNFTASQVQNALQLGGAWDARLIFGTHSWLGLEAAYDGSVNNINSIGLSGNTKLIGTGVQGLARINFTTRSPLQPFIVGGAGWKHYALSGDKFNTSGIRNDDNIVEIPMGGGIAYHYRGLMLDARGMYNQAINSSLFTPAGQSGSNGHPLNTWNARINLGFEL